MIAARSVRAGEVELAELPDPVCGPGEVVLGLLACGVCGSDVSDEWVAGKLPAVLGHELVGVVLESREPGVTTGDRVVVHHHAPCGTCELCVRGRETLCPAFRASGLDPGGFAERIRVPATLTRELIVTGLDTERATFTEPLACVLRAFDRAALTPDDSLLVIGCGTSGLLAVAAARARGVSVSARDLDPQRQALAEELGADPGASGPAEVVLLCAPGPQALDTALAATAPAGRLVVYATPKDGALRLDAARQYLQEITVVSSYSAGPADMQAAHALLLQGAVDPAALVTHRFALAQTGAALEAARTGQAVKALVVA